MICQAGSDGWGFSVCAVNPAKVKVSEWPEPFEATLSADNLPYSTGQFSIDSKLAGQGHFQPTDSSTLENYPSHGARLTMSGIVQPLLVTNIQRCLTCRKPSYHIWFDVVPE